MHPLKYQVRHCCDAEQYEYQHARGNSLDGREGLLVALCLFEDFVALDRLQYLSGSLIQRLLLLGVFENLTRNGVEARGEVNAFDFVFEFGGGLREFEV